MRFKRFTLLGIISVLFSVYPLSAENPRSARESRSYENVPRTLNLPAGALITVRTTQYLSSDRNRPGDEFTVVLDKPIIAQGWVVARPGQDIIGRIVDARKAGRGQGVSLLTLELNEITLVDGQQAPIRTELVQMMGRGMRGNDQAAAVGAATGIGAVIGGVAGGGKGAAIGAAIGAAAGVAGVLTTQGRPTEIYAETGMTFRLEEPVVIATENSSQAFLPVGPRDYNAVASRTPDRYPERVYSAPPRVSYYSNPYDYDYWYNEPSYSFYFGYYRPYRYSAPRVYVRPGHHHRR
jgi:hypothetical protein